MEAFIFHLPKLPHILTYFRVRHYYIRIEHGIRAILTVMEFQPCLYPNHLVHEHLVVKVKDIDQEDISQHF